MSEKIMYWLSVVFSAVALLLLVINVALVSGNRSLQGEIGNRQASINRAIQLSPLNQNLVQALADMSQTKEDKEIRDLLAANGITIRKADAKAAKKQ